jgi:Galactose oxidase-like, Early set domain/Calx-beta domain
MVKVTSLTRTRQYLGFKFWLLALMFYCFAAGTQATAQSDVVGRWSSVPDLPFFPVHAHLLPTGKVMIWPGDEISGNDPRAWDPATATTSFLAKPGYDVFCAGHSFLADGRLLVTGGHIQTSVGLPNSSIYDPFTNTWAQMPNMNAGRWYPTNTTLAAGDVLVVSGHIDTTVFENTLPQVFQTASGTWRSLTNAQIGLDLYPRMHLAPNGRVINTAPSTTTRYLDTSGTGSWSVVGNHSVNVYRDYGSSVMYDDGKILVMGGGADPPTNTAEVIDLNAASPAWRSVASMAFARRQLNATILPDGQVLVTGGTSGPGFNDPTAAVFAAEMWNPATENWTTMASAQIPRLYHSTALLLPDGRILSMGGNGYPQAEIYEPPYLFKGTRPAISSAPESVNYGQTFFVQTPDAADVTQVTWIRLSSVTHAFNMDQRFSRLSFSQVAGGLNVLAPSDPNLAPPGHYMLFILNGNGVPSVAKIIQVTSTPGLPTVTVVATDANAAEAATPNTGTFTVSRTGSTAAALTVNYTVGGTATAGADYTTLSGSVVIPAGSASATITVTPVDDSVSEGDETVVVTLGSSVSYNVGSPSAATVTIADNDAAPPASITLSFNGQIRDRVGQGETALSADGQMDGTFTVTLSTGSGNRTVTRLDLTRSNQSGIWDTQPNNGFWVLGAASTFDAALLNASNGTVNFPLTAGSTFNIFASDFQGQLFVPGSSFTLTVSFADGSTATATASIGALPPVPGLTTLSPNSATAGGPAFTLTVNGSNFVSDSVVQWNGTVRTTTFVSATQLTAAIPASDIAAAGTAQVTVANPGGGTSNALTFTINTGTPAPSLTTLSPNSRTAGGPAFTLTVNGSNFVSGSVVQWNGAARSTTFVSGTQLTAAIPAGDISAAGTAQVRVVNPGGATSNALTFTITSPGFTLTVSRSGNGTVTSTPTGINCGSTCAAAYSPGTVVTLTATPQNKNFPFLGWSGGGCSGTGQCTLTMDATKQVTATFGKN